MSMAVQTQARRSADPVLSGSLAETDPEVHAAISAELDRQESTLEMIASENFAPLSVMAAQGSVLTNKYAEGYPGRRYYGGCEHVDVVEQLAIDRLKALFGAEYANVQPHSGAQANAAAMAALLHPGERILGLDLAHGGHLTHGMRLNFSGQLYRTAAYHVRESDHLVDMAEVERVARDQRPRVIIAGWSAYPRHLDFAEFRRIADAVGAYLMVDMAHFAGLVAAGLHPSPLPYAHVVTSTTHKTLGGPRGGVILMGNPEPGLVKKFNSSVFPGQQGGPLEHVIAAKAVAFKIAAGDAFRDRQVRTLEGARILADRLLADDSRAAGIGVVSGGTDVHLVLVDLRASELDGKQAEDRLHRVGITVNRNAVPFDPRPPMISSGVRIGTPALAARGFGEAEFTEVADIIAAALRPSTDEAALDALRDRATSLAAAHPLYPTLKEVPRSLTPGAAGSTARRAAPCERPPRAAQLPEHPDFLWRNPEPKRSYDVVIVGGGGHGLATAHYLAKNHGITNVAVLERSWLAGGNMARNTTLIRSNYLWDESSAIYEHSLKLWEGLEDDLDYPILFSQRGVLNLAHSLQDVRDSVRRVEANKCNGIDAEWLPPDEVKKVCPIVNTSQDIRYPVLGATYQPRAGIAKHDYVAWGFARRADQAGIDIIQDCAVTGFQTDGSQKRAMHASPGSGRPAATSRRARSCCAPPAPRRCSPTCSACGCPCRATRCRRWSPSSSSRCTRPS